MNPVKLFVDTDKRRSFGGAVDLYQHPERHSGGDYAVEAGAYLNWIAALESGQKRRTPRQLVELDGLVGVPPVRGHVPG